MVVLKKVINKHGYLKLLRIQDGCHIFKAGAAQGGLDAAKLCH